MNPMGYTWKEDHWRIPNIQLLRRCGGGQKERTREAGTDGTDGTAGYK